MKPAPKPDTSKPKPPPSLPKFNPKLGQTKTNAAARAASDAMSKLMAFMNVHPPDTEIPICELVAGPKFHLVPGGLPFTHLLVQSILSFLFNASVWSPSPWSPFLWSPCSPFHGRLGGLLSYWFFNVPFSWVAQRGPQIHVYIYIYISVSVKLLVWDVFTPTLWA